MLLMASAGLGLSEVAAHFPGSGAWQFVGRQCDHAPWAGCTPWDLIQPAFMFMVGVALPWSVANRLTQGETFARMFGHALWRALLLVLLAVFLSSAWSRHTNWTFDNVLAQIGLGYPLLFLLAFAGPCTTWCVALSLLAAYWLAFTLYPLPPLGFHWASVGIGPNWMHLRGFAAHWEKNANLAAAFDVWFLNLFPRTSRFTFSAGGYQTLNFVPSLATMAFGLIAGRLLRGGLPLNAKVKRLVIAGIAAVFLGKSLDLAGVCPIVKRIWTPSWVIFSTGWVTLGLAGFVALVDGRGWKRPAFPLVVVGLNPITLYCLWQLSSGFIREQVRIHFGQGVFTSLGETWSPLLERGVVLLVLWLITWWMYRRKIFVRL
jgi:predicted acyltransferase